MKKFVILLSLLILCASCSKGGNKDSAHERRVVHLSIISQVRSLDPRISNEYPTVHIINMLYEGLMRLGPNGEINLGAVSPLRFRKINGFIPFILGIHTGPMEILSQRMISNMHGKSRLILFMLGQGHLHSIPLKMLKLALKKRFRLMMWELEH